MLLQLLLLLLLLVRRRYGHDELLNCQSHVIGVLGDPEWLVCPGDEEPVDRKRRENHGHADGGLDGGGDHWEDGDGRRQDDVDDGEEEVNLGKQRSRKTVKNDRQYQSIKLLMLFLG